MFKYLIAAPLIATIAVPSFACTQTGSGKALKRSNINNVLVTDRGSQVAMNRFAGGYWVQRSVEGQSGSVFTFIINTDREKSGIQGIELTLHTKRPLTDWTEGQSATFKPYKSVGGSFSELSTGQFACGAPLSRGLTIKPNLFSAKLTGTGPGSGFDKLWYLDSSKSTAKVTRADNPADKTNLTLNAEFNLVLVKPLSSRWLNGEKINEASQKRKVTIKLDGYKFGKRR